MASDLTERLAAAIKEHKTGECGCPQCLIEYAPVFLPLLLSEPELVAGLPMETKVALTCQLLGDGDLRLSVLTPRERAVMKIGEATLVLDGADSRTISEAGVRYNNAMTRYRALPPSPAPMEGRSNE